MAKCGPSGEGNKGSGGSSRPKGFKAPPKTKRKGHPANPFILYYMDMWNKYKGNVFMVAKECGRQWKNLPQSEKDKYKEQYCTNRSNRKSSRGGASGGKGGSSGGETC